MANHAEMAETHNETTLQKLGLNIISTEKAIISTQKEIISTEREIIYSVLHFILQSQFSKN